jgi:glycosyltransferase involved in cell wall biosynthesis
MERQPPDENGDRHQEVSISLKGSAKSASSIASNRVGHPRILLFNFFEGILHRGIPVYVKNLRQAMERQGIECREIACPARLRRLPRGVLNLLFILYEQVFVPVCSLSYETVIHPYNSTSIIDSWRKTSLVVVHDFILSSPRNRRLAARYIRITQWVHARLAGDVAYVSRSSERIGRSAGCFPASRTYLFPNSFYTFIDALPPVPCARQNHILLCSGWGANKDLAGALALYRDSELWRSRPLKILGIAGHAQFVDAFRAESPEVAANITVLPRLEDQQVPEEYYAAAWVWVHSLKEGYGRSIAEARLCGCRVVASDIAPFWEQRDDAVLLYSGLDRFAKAVQACEAMAAPGAREPIEHAVLHQELARYLKECRE